MKVKALIAGIVLATAGSAHAAINTGGAAGGSGELFLSVWDQTAQQSYSQDLGVDVSEFLLNTNSNGFNSNANWSIALDATVWSSFFNAANAASTVYNVVGMNNSNLGLNALAPDYGYVTSFANSNPAPTIQNGTAQINGVIANIINKAALYNAGDTDLAQNDAKVWSSSSPGYYPFVFGSDFNTQAPISQNNQGVYGGSTSVYLHGLDPVFGIDPDLGEPYVVDRWSSNLGSFTLTPTALTFTSASAPVPVPAAVWLFASALAGLVGFSRRGNRA